MKLEFSQQILEKYSDITFHDTSFVWSRVFPCGQTDRRTDMTKLMVISHSFANAPN